MEWKSINYAKEVGTTKQNNLTVKCKSNDLQLQLSTFCALKTLDAHTCVTFQ